ncbi:fibronectin type III domain-containing protein [Spirosoma aerolatum]|uniref:hypothetical protein n=1 Tax=Spirosoma aerolatum TaxID=1211326 RepID=UPI0012D350D6|nr:hypothetical protein [Spirosoma aerolatum]
MKPYLLCLLLLWSNASLAQTPGLRKPQPKPPVKTSTTPPIRRIPMPADELTERASMGIVAKAIGSYIYLRWLPTMQSTFEFGYRDGYVVERINLKTGQRIVLTAKAMPRPAAEWQPYLDRKDRFYAMLYGIIYERIKYPSNILEQMDEKRQVFHFAALSADLDFRAACMAGLGLVDSTARPGERYQYVVNLTSATRYKLKAVTSPEVGLGDPNVLPPIGYFVGKASGHTATLQAKTEPFRKIYNQYQIERSTDSVHYTSISPLPILPTTKQDTLSLSDSLPEIKQTYYYRMRGLTMFQEPGPFTKPIRVRSRENIPSPDIHSVNETAFKDSLDVQWFYKPELSVHVEKYQILGAVEREGPYTVLRDNIRPEQRQINISPLQPVRGFTTFIKLRTIFRQYGRVSDTQPFPVTLADDDPPATPKSLTGTIRTEGELAIVTLHWQPNTESDLDGYFVNRYNGKGDQWHRINNSTTKATTLTDTIYLRQMQREVNYTVKAMDMLFKESPTSPILTLRVPDINPPTSPIIDSFTVADRRIFLHWTRSHSEDVQKHILYRKKMPNANWEELLTITDTLTQAYTDSSVVEKSLYAYTLVAFDDSQNRSQPATPVVLETPFFTRTVDFSQFTSSVIDTIRQTIRLAWACNQTDKIDNFLIYRAMPDDELALVKKVERDSREWIDYVEMLPNKPYRYVIRARMQEGYLSGWKETVIERKP